MRMKPLDVLELSLLPPSRPLGTQSRSVWVAAPALAVERPGVVGLLGHTFQPCGAQSRSVWVAAPAFVAERAVGAGVGGLRPPGAFAAALDPIGSAESVPPRLALTAHRVAMGAPCGVGALLDSYDYVPFGRRVTGE